ncbi:hypothetical protein [Profundibacter amoris]|uniref:hypothetical protein n=1 Tax=Profundibacter amoris TaxID=2171755 RepID=UPI0013C308FA|nr:hypothetical protein [Profundibacter amoris]
MGNDAATTGLVPVANIASTMKADPSFAALSPSRSFDTQSKLQADASMSYLPGSSNHVAAGDRLQSRDGKLFEVAPANAIDYDLKTIGGIALYYVPSPHTGFGQLQSPVYEARVQSANAPAIITSFGGLLYGYFGGRIYSKSGEASAWVEVCLAPDSSEIVALEPMADGEVVAVTSTSIQKSSGWGAGAVTWTSKASVTGGTAVYLPYSTAGSDGVRMIVGEYATGGPAAGWENSQKVWATQDSGATWQAVYDAASLYPSGFGDTHIHGCCYDKWQDVFFVIEGHTSSMGIYWNADPFASPAGWTRIEKGPLGAVRSEGQPTCIVPTDNGIVLASDAPEQGIWGIQRGATPADMQVHWIWEWPGGRGGTLGFGLCHARDPRTGIVYLGYNHNHVADSYNPLAVFASDGLSGGQVWAGGPSTVPTSGNSNDISRIAVTPWGTIEAEVSAAAEVGAKRISGRITANTGWSASHDPGGVLGGSREGTIGNERAMAAGDGSLASANGATAVGPVAKALHAASTAVGAGAKTVGVNSTAVGRSAQADVSGFAGGYLTKAGPNSVVISSNVDLSAMSGISGVGANLVITKDNVVGVGASVNVTNSWGVCIGSFSKSTGLAGTVLGHASEANHAYSTVIGKGVISTAPYQVKFGDQHLQLSPPTSAPGVPALGDFNVWAHDLGGGAGELRFKGNDGTEYKISMTAV